MIISTKNILLKNYVNIYEELKGFLVNNKDA